MRGDMDLLGRANEADLELRRHGYPHRVVIVKDWMPGKSQPAAAAQAPKPPGPEDEWMRRWLRRR